MQARFVPEIKRQDTPPMLLSTRNLLLRALVLLLLATTALLELLRLLIRFFDCLANLPLLLAGLDAHSHALCSAAFRRFANCTFSFFPIGGAGANLISGYVSLTICKETDNIGDAYLWRGRASIRLLALSRSSLRTSSPPSLSSSCKFFSSGLKRC